jgi:hypothetical protein
VSDIAMSKFSSERGLEAKLDALERAENAYFQAKGPPKQQVLQPLPFFMVLANLVNLFSRCKHTP